jgi:peptidoglycan/xylan/chitin deacetylase (PgdA/CDA1 family)
VPFPQGLNFGIVTESLGNWEELLRNRDVVGCLVALLTIWLPLSAAADHQVTRWLGGRGSAVSVTFDDGLYSQASVGASMMNERGFKGSFYIKSEPGWAFWPTYWEDWQTVATAGHEVGSHTVDHAHLTELSVGDARYQLRESRETIEANIDQPPGMTIAYPYGESNDSVEAITAEYYIAGRDVWSPGYMNYYPEDSNNPVDFYAIGSAAFDYPDLTTYERLASYTDTAEAEHAWFIPHIHELDSPAPVAILAQYLDDLENRDNIWIDTLGAVVRYMREREAATLHVNEGETSISLVLTHNLDPEIYNQLLTIRSTVPLSWSGVEISQGGFSQVVEPVLEGAESVVYYDALPNGATILLTPGVVHNLAPNVDAGPDQMIVLPDESVLLDATVADDGLPVPPGFVTMEWSKVSGPGTVTFVDAFAEDTQAIFEQPGTYLLRLTAEDGEWIASDEMTVQFDAEAEALTLEVPVAASSDDAEEGSTGLVYLNSSDLELVYDSYNNAGNQTVGLRFANLEIPAGASIIGAYVQFKVDEVTSDSCLLTIRGQSADNALTFSEANGDITNRTTTAASAAWGPLAWVAVGEADAFQRTPDLASIVQEVVNRPGWQSGNALALILTGSGKRTAEARDGDLAGAPRLVVEYSLGPVPNKAPAVNVGPDQSIVLPVASATLSASVADDGQLDPPASLSLTWSQIGGPAGVSFQNPAAANTTASFPGTGLYTLRLTATDGELIAFDQLTVEVEEEPSGLLTIEVSVAASQDDAEEGINQQVYLDSSDLELVYDSYNNAGNQTVGLRFAGVSIPAGATIINAWVQFKVDEAGTAGCVLAVHGHDTDNAASFDASNGNISARPLTAASTVWAPDGWPAVGAAAVSQRTTDISDVVQEIVDRPGWSSGNAMALVLTGSGKRVAESFDGEPNGAPLLHIEFGIGEAVNKAPTTTAGSDLQLTLPLDSAWLAGSVTDDGLPVPPGALTVAWTQVSGPGVVDFVDAAAAATTAFFPTSGTYVLQLTADDGQWQSSDQVTVVVFEGGGGVEVLEIAISSSIDDAEESSAGAPYLNSSDLELVYDSWDNAGNQTVGLRFTEVALPNGATIVSAYVQFKVDETGSAPAAVTIRGEAADQAAIFQKTNSNLSARATTENAAAWSPAAWISSGAMGPNQQTPDLAPIIQEIANRPGWQSGNSLALILAGSGKRTAESYDGDPSGAPLLHIEYSLGN